MKQILFKIAKIVVNIAFIIWLMYQFINVAPWLASEPIEMLKYTDLVYTNIPSEAKSFSPDKTYAVFHEHGTIKQEPLKFIGHVLAMLFTMLSAHLANRFFVSKIT